MQIWDVKGNRYALPEEKSYCWNNVQDALDMMAESTYLGAKGLIIHSAQLLPEFFDLRTRIAGEILQKFSTYKMKLVIVGDFSNYESQSLKDFIYESNKVGQVVFVSSLEELVQRICF